MTPPTLVTWAGWYMERWDNFIENSDFARTHYLIKDAIILPLFKKPLRESYDMYRELMELIDCSILDVQTLKYNLRSIIAAITFIFLGRHFYQFTQKQILVEFPICSQHLLDTSFAFNNLFSNFMENYAGSSLCGLLPTIKYCSTFFSLQLHLELPIAAKIDRKNILEVY